MQNSKNSNGNKEVEKELKLMILAIGMAIITFTILISHFVTLAVIKFTDLSIAQWIQDQIVPNLAILTVSLTIMIIIKKRRRERNG